MSQKLRQEGAPQVSVVMSCFNNAQTLSSTIESVLSQTYSDFEFLIINDGSKDDTFHILNNYSKSDPRIRVINQNRAGLTRALIHGCSIAQGHFIARQDAGDTSRQERFAKQLEVFRSHPDTSMCSCATEFRTPKGELLYVTALSDDESKTGLLADAAKNLIGPPHHGSTMFRRKDYLKTGGYRKEFYVAQDMDLWIRLVELGEHRSLEQVLYSASVSPNAISSNQRTQQLLLSEEIIRSREARTRAGTDDHILSKIKEVRVNNPKDSRLMNSRYHYFIASNLLDRKNPAAKDHFWQAIKLNPLHLKAWVKFSLFFFFMR